MLAPPEDRAAAARRRHDEAAFFAAREAAMAECLALFAVLHSWDSPVELVRDQARTAMESTGMLWETAARLLRG